MTKSRKEHQLTDNNYLKGIRTFQYNRNKSWQKVLVLKKSFISITCFYSIKKQPLMLGSSLIKEARNSYEVLFLCLTKISVGSDYTLKFRVSFQEQVVLLRCNFEKMR